MTDKKCSKCKIQQPLSFFAKNKTRKNGLQGICKDCQKVIRKENSSIYTIYGKDYKLKNKEELKTKAKKYILKNKDKIQQKRNDHKLIYRYGITREEFQTMYKDQKGLCGICSEYKKVLHVDHNHTTKKIRGLLCGHCNRGLGLFKDNKNNLQKAIKYLS